LEEEKKRKENDKIIDDLIDVESVESLEEIEEKKLDLPKNDAEEEVVVDDKFKLSKDKKVDIITS